MKPHTKPKSTKKNAHLFNKYIKDYIRSIPNFGVGLKKALIFGLALFLVVGVGVLVFRINKTSAQNIVISDIKVDPTANSATFSWKTNVTTEGQVEYWQIAYPDQKQKSTVTPFNTSHEIKIPISPATRNYGFHIIARDEKDNQVISEDQTFQLDEWPLPIIKEFSVLGITDHAVALSWKIDTIIENSHLGDTVIEYGDSSENYTYTARPLTLPEIPNSSTAISSLFSNKKYYARLKVTPAEGDQTLVVYSDEISFTTLANPPAITKITPSEGTYGTEITIEGNNFGNGTGYVAVGRPVAYGIAQICQISNTEIISWSENKVVAKVGEKLYGDSDWASCDPKTGPVYLANIFYEGITFGVPLINIEGPTFTVTGEKSTNTNVAPPTNVNAAPTANAIKNKYGCDFSTTTSNDKAIKVSQLFTENSTTNKYLLDVYNAYKNIWGREPRCTELQFHLDHSTPIDRLTSWLNENAIKNKYGCDFSITTNNDKTIKVKSLFGAGTDTDTYLGDVYNAYKDIWGREPRCTEMQFHLDHSTPIDRLKSWLNDNKPDTAITPTVLPVLEKLQAGNVTKTVGVDKTISFNKGQKITFSGKTAPNSIVILTIESEPIVKTTVSDGEGNWSYTLEDSLSAGEHTVKVAVADKDLKKVSESDPVSFSIIATAKAAETASTTTEEKDNTLLYMIIAVAAAFVIILIIFLVTRKKPKAPEKK